MSPSIIYIEGGRAGWKAVGKNFEAPGDGRNMSEPTKTGYQSQTRLAQTRNLVSSDVVSRIVCFNSQTTRPDAITKLRISRLQAPGNLIEMNGLLSMRLSYRQQAMVMAWSRNRLLSSTGFVEGENRIDSGGGRSGGCQVSSDISIMIEVHHALGSLQDKTSNWYALDSSTIYLQHAIY